MKIVLQASSYLNNPKTILVHFFILPICQILLMLLMLQFYTGHLSVEMTSAMLIMSGVRMAMSMVSGSFVGDINRGIDRLVSVENPLSLYYWGSKIIVAFISALALILVNTVLFAMLQLVNIPLILYLSPILIVFGIVIGLCTSLLSWRNTNHYFYTNIVGSMLTIFSGAVVSYELYPSLFKELTYLFPFGRFLNIIHQNNGNIYIDIFIFSMWCIILCITFSYQSKRIAQKKEMR